MVYTYTEQEKMKVLDTFMNDGKVKQVPSSTKEIHPIERSLETLWPWSDLYRNRG